MRGLSRERWQRIEGILDEVLELPREARAKFLTQACEGDGQLRAEVERLLLSADGESGLLDDSADANAALLLGDEDAARSRMGETVGPYRIVRELARGGMGAVYEAERVDGAFQQRVALKLVRRGMDSEEVQQRFLAERQILARLTHPNIAALLDGGQTDVGQPWFAMELVVGRPITAWCDDRRLGIDARVELVEQVCRAVSYAHRNLVVHRDLKPSNILVTDDGVVKLLDFGIAKLLHDGTAHGDTVTHLGSRAMTPEYAAPEQVRGEAVTTATDIYALGAVLYEILTGHRAHRFRRRSAAEVERVVCEQIPEAPSTVITRTEERELSDGTVETVDPIRVSAARGAPVARLRKLLDGDLDTIALKALRKEPDRRYPSADALLDDLLRRRSGLPVLARQDTLGYRARKFVARNRIAVAAAVVVVLSLGAGLVGTTWQARVASRQAVRATIVKDFLVGLFNVS
ncbi:MAG: serine/threonine-protein kinase, partial [Gemmatimonadota bacterium]